MWSAPSDLVVFVGPSLDRGCARRLLPAAHIAAPLAHGDLASFHAAGASAFLIIDGVFAHRRAAGPAEIVTALRRGAEVFGTASMGAIRAAECRPAGMRGLGGVYRLYRWRVISSDDEVAVATDPDQRFAAVSTALISIRFGLLAALRRNLLDRATATDVLAAAKRMHFSRRTWDSAFDSANVALSGELRRTCESVDVKRRDALRAIEHLAQAAGAIRRGRAPDSDRLSTPPDRAVGHDPQLGYPSATLRAEVPRWLIGSGRHRRYIDAPARPELVWARLEASPSLQAEVMRWHAVRRAAALCTDPPEERWLSDARRSVCTRHGFDDWDALMESVRDGTLAGIPLEWIEDACRLLALARRNLRERDPLQVPHVL